MKKTHDRLRLNASSTGALHLQVFGGRQFVVRLDTLLGFVEVALKALHGPDRGHFRIYHSAS